MLMGEYHHTIDDKNRLVIPSKFRTLLGENFIVTRGLDKCLFVYSLAEWTKIVDKLKTLPFTQQNARNFNRFFLSGAANCEFDRSGRVCIPNPLTEYAKITKDCVNIGVSDRLEIWAKEAWDEFLNNNEDQLSDIAENLFASGDFNA